MVFTDNNPVAHLQSARLGVVEQRWVVQLAFFDFEVKYRAVKENTNMDALFRFPESAGPLGRTSISAVAVTAAGLDDTPKDLCEWKTALMTDPDIQVVRRNVEQGRMPSEPERRTLSIGAAGLVRQYKRLCIQGQALCRKVINHNTHEQ